MAIRAREAMKAIKDESGGRLDITLYTNSVLGGDTAMISQTIAGALEMYTLPLDLLAAKNPACGIFGVGFAFLGYDMFGRRWTVTSAITSGELPGRSAFMSSTIATITAFARSRRAPSRSSS